MVVTNTTKGYELRRGVMGQPDVPSPKCTDKEGEDTIDQTPPCVEVCTPGTPKGTPTRSPAAALLQTPKSAYRSAKLTQLIEGSSRRKRLTTPPLPPRLHLDSPIPLLDSPTTTTAVGSGNNTLPSCCNTASTETVELLAEQPAMNDLSDPTTISDEQLAAEVDNLFDGTSEHDNVQSHDDSIATTEIFVPKQDNLPLLPGSCWPTGPPGMDQCAFAKIRFLRP